VDAVIRRQVSHANESGMLETSSNYNCISSHCLLLRHFSCGYEPGVVASAGFRSIAQLRICSGFYSYRISPTDSHHCTATRAMRTRPAAFNTLRSSAKS
jgi:hypothetical protein